MKCRLFIVSAPSGTGKSTVVRGVLNKREDLFLSVSYTTRKPRLGENSDKDYYFITEDEFKKMINENSFAEWAMVHGRLYGTPIAPIDDALNSGKNVLLDIDVQGGMKLKNYYKGLACTIFLVPPSDEVLRQRLVGRGTDSKDEIEKRLENAHGELVHKDNYDYCVTNDKLDHAINNIISIIDGDK